MLEAKGITPDWAIVVPTVPAASCATTDKDSDVEDEWSDKSEEESEVEEIDDEAGEYASESGDIDNGMISLS